MSSLRISACVPLIVWSYEKTQSPLSRPKKTERPGLASLREWLNQVQNRRPLSEKERLERDLAEAIRLEDYERAARVRDQIRKMQASGS